MKHLEILTAMLPAACILEAVKQDAHEPVKFVEDALCEKCGKFGAFQFEGSLLCSDCYQGCGSCCPEFGADDLWAKREN